MRLGQSLLLASLSTAVAVLPAIAGLELDTEQISISVTEDNAVSKSLRLTTDEDINSLSITVSDLEAEGGDARISEKGIVISSVPQSLSANETVVVDIEIPANVISISGEFTGNLLIQSDGNSQILPITLQVRQGQLWAWVALIVGAGLGVGLSLYRDYGLPKDEIVVQMVKLRTQLEAETDPASERFKVAVNGALQAVDNDSSNHDWQAAEEHLQQGQAIWARWQGYRTDWIDQIKYLETDLLVPLQARTDAYRQRVRSDLKDVQRQLPTYEKPQALAEVLQPLQEQLNRFQEADNWISAFSDLISELESMSDEKDEQKRIKNVLESSLESLYPKDIEKFQILLKDIKSKYDHLSKLVSGTENHSSDTGDRSDSIQLHRNFVSPVPEQSGIDSIIQQGNVSRRNLKLFRLITPVVTVGVIAWIGMAERYEQEATFGANPIGDYLGLFLWGFGAEVSRDAVVKALGTLKHPLSQSKKEEIS